MASPQEDQAAARAELSAHIQLARQADSPEAARRRFLSGVREQANAGQVSDSERQMVEQRAADGLWDHLKAGWETSVTGLRIRGEAPERVISEHSGKVERLVAMTAMMVGDLPTLIVGGVGGGLAGAPGGPVGIAAGAGAGSMGLTEGTRRWMLDKYAEGASRKDIAERITATAFATSKGVLIGGLTGGAGAKTLSFVRGLPAQPGELAIRAPTTLPRVQSKVGQGGVVTAAEAATLVGVASTLEGEIPKAEDFIDAAVMLGGLRVGVGSGRAAVRGVRRIKDRDQLAAQVDAELQARAARLEELYARTGKRPDEVAKEAASDSRLWQDLIDESADIVPLRYKALEESPLRPDTRRNLPADADPRHLEIARDPFRARETPRDQRTRENLNWDVFDLPEGPRRLADELSKQFRDEIRRETGGRVANSETVKRAEAWLRDALGEQGLKTIFEPGSAEWAAEVLARKTVVKVTLQDAWRKAERVVQAGGKASAADLADLVLAQERAERALAVFRGRSAEGGRVMQIQQDLALPGQVVENEAALLKQLERFGGKDAARALAEVTAAARSPRELANIAIQPTTFEKIMEGVKAMALSGFSTMQITTLGNVVFAATRVPEKHLAAVWGRLRTLPSGSKERQNFADAYSYTVGLAEGAVSTVSNAWNAVRLGIDQEGFMRGLWEAWKAVDSTRKAELSRRRGAIPGAFGHIVRGPFKVAQLGDALSAGMERRAQIAEWASRQAIKEGHTPGTRAWRERKAELMQQPSSDLEARLPMLEDRASFMERGPASEALHAFVGKLPATEPIILFRTAVAAIPREAMRRTLLAPIIRAWREDWKLGGAERDKAMGEVLGGLAVGLTAFLLARDGVFTGGGHPDPKQRDADYDAGFQAYSARLADGRLVQYKRWEPWGTLIGMAADMSTAWDLMTGTEKQQAVSALMWAGREVFANKTWLQGVSRAVNAITQPDRHAEGWLEDLAGLAVPNILAQTARQMDPYMRETDNIWEAVQSRIPKWREQLKIRRDGFGQPIEAAGGLWPLSPSITRQMSGDPVRLKAMELGVAMPRWPKKLQAGSVFGESAGVELTRDERDIFETEAGQLSHQILGKFVGTPGFERLPAIQQRQMFERVYGAARKQAAISALPPEKRLEALQSLMREEGLVP